MAVRFLVSYDQSGAESSLRRALRRMKTLLRGETASSCARLAIDRSYLNEEQGRQVYNYIGYG